MSHGSKNDIDRSAKRDEAASTPSVASQALSDDALTAAATTTATAAPTTVAAAPSHRAPFLRTSYFNGGYKANGMNRRGDRAAVAEEEEEKKHILASRYKTKLCKSFLATGRCPYEVRCMFAHGEEEVRTSEQNIADGLTTEEAIKIFQAQHFDRFGGGYSAYSRRHGYHGNGNNGGVSRWSPRRSGSRSNHHHHRSSYPSTNPVNRATVTDAVPVETASLEEHLHLDTTTLSPPLENGEEQKPLGPLRACHLTAYPYLFAHNPYALDLLAPEDRMYSTPFLVRSHSMNEEMDRPMSSDTYFPAQEMLEEEEYPLAGGAGFDGSDQPSYLCSGGNPSGSAYGGCSAVELEEANLRSREMILEP